MESLTDLLSETGLKRRSPVSVLTGAGVSAESGVPTFRGEEGLWKNFRAEELATPEAFDRDPATVWEWYDYRRRIIAAKEPNPAHRAITRLDEAFPDFLLITQNVDGLHARAGTRRIAELHGNLFRVRCTRDGEVSDNLGVPLTEIPPRCKCGSLLRPDVVWFGEGLPREEFDRAFNAAEACKLMLVVGTSAVVQPAASIPLVAKQAGALVVEVNPDPTPLTDLVDLHLRGNAGEVLPRVVDILLDFTDT
ncbi:MAG: NAD-dependent deacylase [Candidatus Eisenbacteria bacterium]